MSAIRYMMVTVAACAPSFLNDALKEVGALAEELKKDAGAAATRYGVLATGQHTGSLILFQSYGELNGIDRAFDVYGTSKHYKAIVASGHVTVSLRNIIRLEDVGLKAPSPDVPAYGVLTRWTAADPMVDRVRKMVPLFEKNGAMILRYGTIMTGDAAGHRLMGVTYPSMDAIEKTYDALRASDDYTAMLSDISIDWRNIVRIAG